MKQIFYIFRRGFIILFIATVVGFLILNPLDEKADHSDGEEDEPV